MEPLHYINPVIMKHFLIFYRKNFYLLSISIFLHSLTSICFLCYLLPLNCFLCELFSYGLDFGSVWTSDQFGLRISLGFGSVWALDQFGFASVWASDQSGLSSNLLEMSDDHLERKIKKFKYVWALDQSGA